MFCPNCGKEIQDGSKFCKYCGFKIEEETSIGARGKSNEYQDKVTSYETPNFIPLNMIKKGERIVFEVHPHKVYSLLGSWFFGGLIAIIGIPLFKSYSIAALILEIIALLILLIPYLQWRATIYALTTDRVIRMTGVIGKDFYENPLDKVQDIRLKMGVMQRLFRCGDIMITTAGTSLVECVWKNIGNPLEAQKKLRALLGR